MPYRSRSLARDEREAELEREIATLLGGPQPVIPVAAVEALVAELGEVRRVQRERSQRSRRKLRVVPTEPCMGILLEPPRSGRSRRCPRCSLYVHDLAGLTANEAVEMIESMEGRRCDRLYRRWDGAVLTRRCQQSWSVSSAVAFVGMASLLLLAALVVYRASAPKLAPTPEERALQRELAVRSPIWSYRVTDAGRR